MDRQPERVSKRDQVLALAGWLAFLAQVLATSVEVLLRQRFGERYFGLHSAAVLLVIPVYCLFWERYEQEAMMWFLALYLVGCAVGRIGILVRRARGHIEHSGYGGFPCVLKSPLFRKASEVTAKRIIEPALVFASGLALFPFDRPLGVYLMLAAGALVVTVQLALGYERARLVGMRDAFIEQKNLMERFRQRR